MSIGASFLLADGYTGQTTETLALPSDPAPFERIVGVPLKPYVSLTWTCYLKKCAGRSELPIRSSGDRNRS
jgi:hypothetical protein